MSILGQRPHKISSKDAPQTVGRSNGRTDERLLFHNMQKDANAFTKIFSHLSTQPNGICLKEVTRLLGAGLVYFRVYPAYHEQRRLQTATALQDAFRPVKPRRQITYPPPTRANPFRGFDGPQRGVGGGEGRGGGGGGVGDGDDGGRGSEAGSNFCDKVGMGEQGRSGGGGSGSAVAVTERNLPTDAIVPPKKHQKPFALNVLPLNLLYEKRRTQVQTIRHRT